MPSQNIEAGSWVARFASGDHPEIARVKYVRPALQGGKLVPLLDLVRYSITGERQCKGPPPIGETEPYDRGVPAWGWEVIGKPDFEMLPLAMERAAMLAMLRVPADARV